jgi:phosphate transport system protein
MLPSNHSSKHFDAELDRIRARVLHMGGLVEYQVRHAMDGLRRGDNALCFRVLQEEVKVNRLEREIDEACTQVIARRAPTANDLRFLIAVYKTLTDLERIGDEAKKIAFAARETRFSGHSSADLSQVLRVAELVIEMLRRALDGLARLKAEEMPAVLRQDEEVDKQFKAILHRLLIYMIEDPRLISPALDVILIAKALERIGDHAKNISEYVVYAIKGTDVRHLPIAEIEAMTRS